MSAGLSIEGVKHYIDLCLKGDSTIPERAELLDYYLTKSAQPLYNAVRVFDDIFARYLTRCELVQVKTTNMGSLFKLEYRIVFREEGEEKNMIDQLRCRNGNLEILCSRAQTGREEL